MKKVKIEESKSAGGKSQFYVQIPTEVIKYFGWKHGDTLELDLPTAGADIVLSKVGK